MCAQQPGDLITVVGAAGGVGQILTAKLLEVRHTVPLWLGKAVSCAVTPGCSCYTLWLDHRSCCIRWQAVPVMYIYVKDATYFPYHHILLLVLKHWLQ